MKRAFLLVLVLVAAMGTAHAESLWRANSKSLYADLRARQVGDLLTILVVESTQTSHIATHKTAKGVETETEGGTGPVLSWIPELSLSTSRKSDGSGSTATATRVTDRLSVTVAAIDAQGNLLVMGNRVLELGADKVEMKFSGIVRPTDISADNTVLSSNVADLQVSWSGRGPIAEKQKPGLLYRLLHFLW